jgi:hypothetical protein
MLNGTTPEFQHRKCGPRTQNAFSEKGLHNYLFAFFHCDKGQLVSIWEETVNNSVALHFIAIFLAIGTTK